MCVKMSGVSSEAAADEGARRRRRFSGEGGGGPRGVSALMYACQQGNVEAARREIHVQPSSLNRLDRTGKSALHYCCTGDRHRAAFHRQAADLLLMAAPDLLDGRDEDGFTPLHLAVIAGNVPLVTFLLASSADVNALDGEQHTVVHWATVCGETEALRAVLAAGAPVSTPDVHGGYPLHYAAQMCGGEKDHHLGYQVLQALLEHPEIDVAVADGDGRQPLLWAASAGSARAMLALIRAGAEPEAADKDGLTALHCAASRGHTDCLDTLLTLCGASVDVIDSNGCTALHYAVTLGHADATALLLAHGANGNRQDRKGRSPAHCGCAKGQLETVKMLGSHGANLWLRNARGDLPLHEASSSGRRDLVKWLLESRPSQVNARNNDGRCPLHLAALNDNADMCKILLDNGALVNPVLRTSKNVFMTPLDCALQRGFRATAKYLQLQGGQLANRIATNPPATGISLQIRDDVTFWGDTTDSGNEQTEEKRRKRSYKKKVAYKFERKNSGRASGKGKEEGKVKEEGKAESPREKLSFNSEVKVLERQVEEGRRPKSGKFTKSSKKKRKADTPDPRRKESQTTQTPKSPKINENIKEIETLAQTIELKAKNICKEVMIIETNMSEKRPEVSSMTSEDSEPKNLLVEASVHPPPKTAALENLQTELNALREDLKNFRTNEEKEEFKELKKHIEDIKLSLSNKSETCSHGLEDLNLKELKGEIEGIKLAIQGRFVKEVEEENVVEEVREQTLIPDSAVEAEIEAEVVNQIKDDAISMIKAEDQLEQSGEGRPGRNDEMLLQAIEQIKEEAKKSAISASHEISIEAINKILGIDPKKISKEVRKAGEEAIEEIRVVSSQKQEEQDMQEIIKGVIQQFKDDTSLQNDLVVCEEIKVEAIGRIKESSGRKFGEKVVHQIRDEAIVKIREKVGDKSVESAVNLVRREANLKIRETAIAEILDEAKEYIGSLAVLVDGNQEMRKLAIQKIGEQAEKGVQEIVEKSKIIIEDEIEQREVDDAVEAILTRVIGDMKEEVVKFKKEEEKVLEEEKIVEEVTAQEEIIEEVKEEKVKVVQVGGCEVFGEEVLHESFEEEEGKEGAVEEEEGVREEETKCEEKGSQDAEESEKVFEDSSETILTKTETTEEIAKEEFKPKKFLKNKKKDHHLHIPRDLPDSSLEAKSSEDEEQNPSDSSSTSKRQHKSFTVLEESRFPKRKTSRKSRPRSEDTQQEKSHIPISQRAKSNLESRVPVLPNLTKTKSESNLAEDYSEASDEERVEGRKRRLKKKKARGSKSAGSDYESSNLIDSGFEPSPRSSRIPKWKNVSDRGVNMTSVTQTIQGNIRRYHLERKIFQHLLDLKRLQIRAGQHNESMLVKRAIDAYHRSCAATVGAGRYIPDDYTFKSFELFLYESLRKIQRQSAPEYLKGLPENVVDHPLLCTQSTNRCMHATHAYTGVPCAAYLPKMDHHSIPKIGFNGSCKPQGGFLPNINGKKAVTLELCHGNDKQVISLPTDRLDQNKRYYVTFTVKGQAENSSSSGKEGDEIGHRHSKSV